jgi:hypothetical protein
MKASNIVTRVEDDCPLIFRVAIMRVSILEEMGRLKGREGRD